MTPYHNEIVAAATAHGLDVELLDAQVMVESSHRADAFRYEPGIAAQLAAGALTPKHLPANPVDRRVCSSYGLLQILYITACDYGFADEPELLFVPSRGLEFGCKHLAALLQWAGGDYVRALSAYNGGKGGNFVAPYRNQAYALRVQAMAHEL